MSEPEFVCPNGCGCEPAAEWSHGFRRCSKCNAKERDSLEVLRLRVELAQRDETIRKQRETAELSDMSAGHLRKGGAVLNQRLTEQLAQRDETVAALEAQKNGAYAERDKLVCALSKFIPSFLERHPESDTEWDDDWRWIVFVTSVHGQMSWHIHDSELWMFSHLPVSKLESWDGHTTEEKYWTLADLPTLFPNESRKGGGGGG